jgi:hypothetical protein
MKEKKEFKCLYKTKQPIIDPTLKENNFKLYLHK